MLLPFLSGLLWTSTSAAQANYQSALIGGRSSLLGGTGVVTGTDAAAPLQNPATTVDIEGTSFVFSTFFVELSGRSLTVDPDLIDQIERGTTELSQVQFRVLPTSTCLFFDLGDKPISEAGHHKFSVCLAEPESEDFQLNSRALASTTDNGTGFRNQFLTQQFSKRTYTAGWAMTLGRGLSVGLTPILEEVNFKGTESLATLLSTADTPDQVVGSEVQQATTVSTQRASAFALSALMGLRYQHSPRFGVGISLQTPSLHLTGSYRATRSSEEVLGTREEYSQSTGSARYTYPLRLALGLAGYLGPVFLEANGYFHNARSDFVEIDSLRQSVTSGAGIVTGSTEERVIFRERTHPTANVGLGVEIPLRLDWKLLLGFLTDFSGLTPRQSGALADNTLFRQRADLLHGSVGVAWSPRLGTLLLGTRFFYGEGELSTTDQRTIPPQLVKSSQSLWGLSFVVSGQLSLQMLALADPTGLLKKATGEAPDAKAPAPPPRD